jgi:hypothetical protein
VIGSGKSCPFISKENKDYQKKGQKINLSTQWPILKYNELEENIHV